MNSILSVPPWFIRDGKLFCYSSFIANPETVFEPQTGTEPAKGCGFDSESFWFNFRLGLRNIF